MAFTAADVKNLREMTGVGMMDCKKALTASDGDMDKAVEWLREKGMAASAKKAGRIAAEGMAYAAVIDGVGVVVEVNAETDFVGKNEKFVEFVKGVAATVAAEKPADLDLSLIHIFIWKKIEELAAQGVAVLLVSQELNEVMEVSDRIQVIYDGRLYDGGRHGELTETEIGLLMTGGGERHEPAEAQK